MPEILETQCPHCEATMKLKSRKALGKKAPCPKCRKPFVVKEKELEATDEYGNLPTGDDITANNYVDDYGEDDGDDYGEDYEDDDAPRQRSSVKKSGSKKSGSKKSRSKKKRTKKQAAPGKKPALLIGGGVFGAGVVGLLIWLVIGLFSNKIELAYLPPDAHTITVERVASAWDQKNEEESHSDVDGAIEKMKEDWGFGPQDVKSLTTAISRNETLKVLRTSVDLDRDKILKNGGDHKKVSHNGEDYYLIGGSALYFPDDRTAISGSEQSVKKAIERGPKVEDREEIEFADAGYHHVTVSVSVGDRKLGKNSLLRGMFGKQSGDWKMGEVKAMAIGRTITGSGSGKASFQFWFTNKDDAIKAEEQAEKELDAEKETWEETGRENAKNALKTNFANIASVTLTDDDFDEIVDSQEKSLKSRSVSRSGNVLSLKLNVYAVSQSLREKVRGNREKSSSRDYLYSRTYRYFGFSRRQRRGFNFGQGIRPGKSF